jgi:hypothetical protein
MRSAPSSSVRILDSPDAARFITDPASFRFLQPFMARARFPSEVALELGVSIGAVSYRVNQMVSLGLIELVEIVARAGRPMRSYQAVSNNLFAPMDLTPATSLGALMREGRLPGEDTLRAALEQAWLRVSREHRWGTHAYLSGPDGGINRDFVPIGLASDGTFWEATLADDSPAVWDQIAALNLSRDDAKSLQRELAGLVERYAGHGSGATTYLLHLAMAPTT